jgi:Uma2 family endonuclease
MMVQAPVKLLTLDEFLLLPETKPASEFFDGLVCQKPMPQGKHSTLQLDLGGDINGVLKRQRIGRAFSELRCSFGGRSIVPDLAVFRWERIPRDPDGEVANSFLVAPDWTIEILSPDQSHSKVVRNILHCLEYGCEMGWLVDPMEKLVFVYFNDRPLASFELAMVDAATVLLPVPGFAVGFEITVAELFGYLNE